MTEYYKIKKQFKEVTNEEFIRNEDGLLRIRLEPPINDRNSIRIFDGVFETIETNEIIEILMTKEKNNE